jgi:hypothetical protein
MSQIQIGRQLGLNRLTVRRCLRPDGFPERKQGYRVSSVEAHAHYLEQRLQQGCHNATQLWREVRERGFHGRQRIVRIWIGQRLGPRSQPGAHAIAATALRTCPVIRLWLILTEPASTLSYLEELYRRSPEIAAAARVARVLPRRSISRLYRVVHRLKLVKRQMYGRASFDLLRLRVLNTA